MGLSSINFPVLAGLPRDVIGKLFLDKPYVQEQRIDHGLELLVLVSADVELNAAARREGLDVEDPNAHQESGEAPVR
jgi:hypothetical protein